jgi:hypothetical protein
MVVTQTSMLDRDTILTLNLLVWETKCLVDRYRCFEGTSHLDVLGRTLEDGAKKFFKNQDAFFVPNYKLFSGI